MKNRGEGHSVVKRRGLIASMLAVLGLVVAVAVIIALPNKRDVARYQQLLSVSKTKLSDQVPKRKDPYVATQLREGVTKEIILGEAPYQRRHLTISSKMSELTFSHNGSSAGIVEKMEGLSCLFQEELYYRLPDGREVIGKENGRWQLRSSNPKNADSWIDLQDEEAVIPMQIVQQLEADSGSYDYSQDLFIAKRADIKRYCLKGHDTKTLELASATPIMRGRAESVEFCLDGGGRFKAHHLKARFYPEEEKK